MLNFLICGIAGHMGGNILELLKDDGEARAACGVISKFFASSSANA